MEIILQFWGGTGYLLAKVLLVRAEFAEHDKNFRLVGWIAYLLGLPAWVILFANKQDWIAAAMETAGVPAMILGIVTTWKQQNNPYKIIDRCIGLFTGLMIIIGVSYSIYTFNGIKNLSQILEIISIIGYLVGTNLLAKRNPFAWLMYAQAHGSMSLLMYIQGKPILCMEQVISVILVIIGFIKAIQKTRNTL